MIKVIAVSIVAVVLSLFGAQAFAQTATPTPTGETTATPTAEVTTTATPTPTGSVQGTSDVTVPSGAPSTGFGGM